MCDEIANAPHTHLYVQFKHPIYFNHMKEVFPSAHIEEAQGTAEENRAYIRKEGKWQDTEKEATNLKETFEEWGNMPTPLPHAFQYSFGPSPRSFPYPIWSLNKTYRQNR